MQSAGKDDQNMYSLLEAAGGESGPEDAGSHAAPCFSPGSVSSTTFILACVSMGIGVFSFPAVFKLSGIVGGVLLLCLFAFLSAFAQRLLLLAAKRVHATSYEETTQRILGRYGSLWQTVCLAVGPFIANCAHVQAVGYILGDILVWFVTGEDVGINNDEFHMPNNRRTVLYILVLCIPLPFCFQDDVNSLRHVALTSVAVVLLNTLFFIGYSFDLLANGDAPAYNSSGHVTAGSCDGCDVASTLPAFGSDVGDYFRAAGAICFAFSGANNLFAAVREMKRPQLAGRPIAYATTICFAVYLCCGLVGAVVFGSGAQSNCLYNVKIEDRQFNRWLVFALIVCILLLYPIINFPMVESLQALFWGSAKSAHPWWSRPAISVVGVIGVALVDLVVSDLVDLFGLCGSLGLGSTAYILPSLCFLVADPRPILSPIKLGAMAVLVAGAVVVVVSTIFIVMNVLAG